LLFCRWGLVNYLLRLADLELWLSPSQLPKWLGLEVWATGAQFDSLILNLGCTLAVLKAVKKSQLRPTYPSCIRIFCGWDQASEVALSKWFLALESELRPCPGVSWCNPASFFFPPVGLLQNPFLPWWTPSKPRPFFPAWHWQTTVPSPLAPLMRSRNCTFARFPSMNLPGECQAREL
jgi:hypothetical protein